MASNGSRFPPPLSQEKFLSREQSEREQPLLLAVAETDEAAEACMEVRRRVIASGCFWLLLIASDCL